MLFLKSTSYNLHLNSRFELKNNHLTKNNSFYPELCIVIWRIYPPFFFSISICFLRYMDRQYLLCTTGLKQGSKGGIRYTHLSLETDARWFFARARLLAAIWLIIAAILSNNLTPQVLINYRINMNIITLLLESFD